MLQVLLFSQLRHYKSSEEICKDSERCDGFSVKRKQADEADECWFSADKAFGKKHGFLAKGLDTTLQLREDHEEQLAVQKKRIDAFKVHVADLTVQMMKVEE